MNRPNPTLSNTRGATRSPGQVSLVGAGPGDPELLTLRAVRRLGEADLVLYDALVPLGMRELAPQARWVYVGKRAARPGVAQETLHRLMVRGARQGLRLVRLKCGDPCVLGRGGEEALAMVAAGIPCELVPGVSSALAAPELAGIPVTHRGLASGFLVLSGHAASAYAAALGSLAPASATLVILMGAGRRREIVELLLARGWAAETPAAALLGASGAGASSWIGTLAGLPEAQLERPDQPPCTLVIGAVVSLAETLSKLGSPAPGVAEASGVTTSVPSEAVGA